MLVGALSLLVIPMFSAENLVAIHPHGCDNKMMHKLCHSDEVNECYTCVKNDTNTEVCVPIFKNNHEYKNPLDRFPSTIWNCTIHRHDRNENKTEQFVNEKIVYEIFHNKKEHEFPIYSSYLSDCIKEKLNCMLSKSCRKLIKELNVCASDSNCIMNLISTTNDENFLGLVKCKNVN